MTTDDRLAAISKHQIVSVRNGVGAARLARLERGWISRELVSRTMYDPFIFRCQISLTSFTQLSIDRQQNTQLIAPNKNSEIKRESLFESGVISIWKCIGLVSTNRIAYRYRSDRYGHHHHCYQSQCLHFTALCIICEFFFMIQFMSSSPICIHQQECIIIIMILAG